MLEHCIIYLLLQLSCLAYRNVLSQAEVSDCITCSHVDRATPSLLILVTTVITNQPHLNITVLAFDPKSPVFLIRFPPSVDGAAQQLPHTPIFSSSIKISKSYQAICEELTYVLKTAIHREELYIDTKSAV